MGKEAAEETVNNLQSDIKILKDQIIHEQQERKAIAETLVSDMKLLR